MQTVELELWLLLTKVIGQRGKQFQKHLASIIHMEKMQGRKEQELRIMNAHIVGQNIPVWIRNIELFVMGSAKNMNGHKLAM